MIKVVLSEPNKKNKWLTDELGKNLATVSLWCNKVQQSSIVTLAETADNLNFNIRQLLNATKDK